MGSRFNRPNVKPPMWLAELKAAPPSCFTPPQWDLYLAGVVKEAMAQPQLRKQLDRGARPEYCDACTSKHRAAMEAADKCHPPEEAEACK